MKISITILWICVSVLVYIAFFAGLKSGLDERMANLKCDSPKVEQTTSFEKEMMKQQQLQRI